MCNHRRDQSHPFNSKLAIHIRCCKYEVRHFGKEMYSKIPRHAGSRIHGNDECVPGLDYSFNADIWGVGILAFECCTGKGPYEKTGKCVCTRARHV